MIEVEQEPHICFECDAEFVVHSAYAEDQPVSFCPFCGSEIEDEESFDDLDEDEDDTETFR